jgi:hypothetical protein
MKIINWIIGLTLLLNFQILLAHSHEENGRKTEGVEKYYYELLNVIDAGILHECLIDGLGGIENLNNSRCIKLTILTIATKLGYLELRNSLTHFLNNIDEVLDHVCAFYAMGFFVKEQEMNPRRISVCAVIYPVLKSILIYNRKD